MSELKAFLNSPSEQQELAEALTKFSRLCAAQAQRSGFTSEPNKIRAILHADRDTNPELYEWFRDCEIQAELARIGSEVGEAVEAVRKPDMDHHLPNYDNFVVELGDILIRIGDTAGRRKMTLGEATVAKMVFNSTRARKHGKTS